MYKKKKKSKTGYGKKKWFTNKECGLW